MLMLRRQGVRVVPGRARPTQSPSRVLTTLAPLSALALARSMARHSSSSSGCWADSVLLVARRGCDSGSSSVAASLACPECGKVFRWQRNLARHRAARHGLVTSSPADERLDALVKQTEALERALTERRVRLKAMRRASNKAAAVLTGKALDAARGASSGDAGQVAHFAAAVPAGRATLTVAPEVVTLWQRAGTVLGNNVTRWVGVGVVCGPVEVGTLEGFAERVDAAPPRVLQFSLQVHGFRERRPAQLRLFRNTVSVRCLLRSSPDADVGAGAHAMNAFCVREGDVVRVQGNYAVHASYDLISKQSVEHVVVEADMVGLLQAAPPSVTVPKTPPSQRSSAAPMTPRVSTPPAEEHTADDSLAGPEQNDHPHPHTSSRKIKKPRKWVVVKRKKKTSHMKCVR